MFEETLENEFHPIVARVLPRCGNAINQLASLLLPSHDPFNQFPKVSTYDHDIISKTFLVCLILSEIIASITNCKNSVPRIVCSILCIFLCISELKTYKIEINIVFILPRTFLGRLIEMLKTYVIYIYVGTNVLVKFLLQHTHTHTYTRSHDSGDCAFCRRLCAEES